MQRRALSPLGLRRQRFGRKALASSRMATSIERKLPTTTLQKKPSRPSILSRYTFHRWHAFALLGYVAAIIIASFGYGQYRQVQVAEQQRQQTAQQKADLDVANKRQACYKQIVTEKAAQVNTLTYDQLYGKKCQ